MSNNRGPRRWFYGLAILIMLTGSAIFVVFLLQGTSGLTQGMVQVIVPGTHDVQLQSVYIFQQI